MIHLLETRVYHKFLKKFSIKVQVQTLSSVLSKISEHLKQR